MNKEKFLKELEKKLSILNEKERKDIIEEYKSTIEEKIKNGENEENAVKDFGNIDDLAKEILEAYKINPEYKENDFQKFVNEGEKIIKECADSLAKGTKDIVENFKKNNEEINLSLVFEILIKVFLTVIILGLLRIPFMIFTSISNGIFSALFSPIDAVIKAFWSLFLTVIYLILVVLIVAVCLDRLLNTGHWVFRTLVAYFYIANEGLSLIENCAALGAPVPQQIVDALSQLKEKKTE